MGPPGILHVQRRRFLWDERLYEKISIVNYSRDVVLAPLTLEYGADFRDMFEVRGATRPRRGVVRPPVCDGRSVRFGYEGLDQVERASIMAFSDAPWRIGATGCRHAGGRRFPRPAHRRLHCGRRRVSAPAHGLLP